MQNRERPSPEGRSDWPIRITGAIGAGAGMALALLLGPVVGIAGMWQGMLAVAVAVTVGGVLGRLVGGLLFRKSSGGQRDYPPADGPGETANGRTKR